MNQKLIHVMTDKKELSIYLKAVDKSPVVQ